MRAVEYEPPQAFREAAGWNSVDFAREQIRGLVRQVFFCSAVRPVRQVVFCGADPTTDTENICRQVGEALALDTSGSVVVVSRNRNLPR